MIEAPLIVVGGLLGAGHCIGMCGGFVLTLGSQAASRRDNLVRQVVYALGRVVVYALAGAFVGFGTARLGLSLSDLVPLQAILALVAGAMLVAEGFFSAGWVPRPFAASGGCPGATVFATLLRAPHLAAVFVAGVVNGMLPCGLVYAYLALAASAGHIGQSALVMALFGVGTLPAMVLTGLAGSLLTHVWRRRIVLVAASCMIVTGALSIWRGVAAFDIGTEDRTACPMCRDESQQ